MKTAKRLRAAAGLLALLLALAGCGGDTTDLTAPTMTVDGTSVVTTSPDRHLTGTVEAGAVMGILIGSTVYPVTVAGTAWSSDVLLAPGVNTVSITAQDVAGNTSSLSLTLTYDPLSIEVYTSPIAGSSQTLYGLVDPLNYTPPLQLTVTPEDTAVPPFTVTATVAGDTWSADLAGLATGNNLVTLGNQVAGQAALTERSVTINVNASAPAFAFDDAGIIATPVPGRVVTGTLETGNLALALSPLPAELAPVVDSAAGSWSGTYSLLVIGKNALTATLVGNSGVITTAHSLIRVEQTPPLVVRQVVPVEGASGVALDAQVAARFSAAMDPATLTSTNFRLDAGLVPVAASITYDAVAKTATLVPAAQLAAGTVYTVTLTTGLADEQGHPLPQDISWTFTTAP